MECVLVCVFVSLLHNFLVLNHKVDLTSRHAPIVDAADSMKSGEFLHAYLGSLTSSFGSSLFPGHYVLQVSPNNSQQSVCISFANDTVPAVAHFVAEMDQIKFADGRVWTRYFDARVVCPFSIFSRVLSSLCSSFSSSSSSSSSLNSSSVASFESPIFYLT